MTATIEQRFWAKVAKADGDACWEWIGGRGDHGYGVFWMDGRLIGAHRVSWVLANGPIPKGLFVCHRCDNPSCVRPDHLFTGTATDNAQDMLAKGRHRPSFARGDQNGSRTKPECLPRGEAHGCAKLSESDVIGIRRMASSRRPQREIARHYGVTQAAVSLIVLRKKWAHVADEAIHPRGEQ